MTPTNLTIATTPQQMRLALGHQLQCLGKNQPNQPNQPQPSPAQIPCIMGIINATPNSFSDGGDLPHLEDVLQRARDFKAEGADILDIGGASSHPNAPHTPLEVELQRVLPVIQVLHQHGLGPISIDTQHPVVAADCLKAGAHLINDVSGLCASPNNPQPLNPNGIGQASLNTRASTLTEPAAESTAKMALVAAQFNAPLVITCNQRNHPIPPTTALMPSMAAFFEQRIAIATRCGATQLVLDPGYGFGKTMAQNLQTLRDLSHLLYLGYPILVCTSRKGSLGKLCAEPKPKQRLGANLASALFAWQQGASIIRAHDIKPLRQLFHLWHTLHHPR